MCAKRFFTVCMRDWVLVEQPDFWLSIIAFDLRIHKQEFFSGLIAGTGLSFASGMPLSMTDVVLGICRQNVTRFLEFSTRANCCNSILQGLWNSRFKAGYR